MLALSPLRNIRDERQRKMEDFLMGGDDFTDFSGGNLLIDSIDLDDIFVGINDGDVFPDLEMDSEILAEFSLSGVEESEMNNTSVTLEEQVEDDIDSRKDEVHKASASNFGSVQSSNQAEDAVISKPNEYCVAKTGNISSKESDKGKKSSSSSSSLAANQSKNSQGKRKVKVDWTPELHRRFVQAVEQLGVDKAVPSRILELMAIDCLTRHNIASHLQKYRSHRKHLLAREAEAASWNQKGQVYGGAVAANGGNRNMNTWLVPTIGFPPMAPPVPHFRPLHVWGHPSVDQSLLHIWPKQLVATSTSPPPPPPTWTPHPPADPSFWHAHRQRATHCFGAPVTPTQRFQTPPVPGIPPPNMYKVGPAGIGVPPAPLGQTLPKPPLDFQPSRERVDAAIGDVLSKPWLPLPLRLKPPSVDSVLAELQRQGISKVP